LEDDPEAAPPAHGDRAAPRLLRISKAGRPEFFGEPLTFGHVERHPLDETSVGEVLADKEPFPCSAPLAVARNPDISIMKRPNQTHPATERFMVPLYTATQPASWAKARMPAARSLKCQYNLDFAVIG